MPWVQKVTENNQWYNEFVPDEVLQSQPIMRNHVHDKMFDPEDEPCSRCKIKDDANPQS